MQNKLFLRIIYLFYTFFLFYMRIALEIITGKELDQSNKKNALLDFIDVYMMQSVEITFVEVQLLKTYEG
jgi:hypothetical protein